MHPRHVVMATGVSGIPSLPDIPTLRNFGGAVLHSSQYDDGEKWRGQRVLVVGSGNSGHDIAQDLHSSGARVTLVQRSSTMIVNVEPSAQLPYALYARRPFAGGLRSYRDLHPAFDWQRKATSSSPKKAKNLDQDLLDGLRRVGSQSLISVRTERAGKFKYLTRGGGYYFNVGCSDLIVKGRNRAGAILRHRLLQCRGARE